MAIEAISKILEVEKNNAEDLKNAKLNAAQMIKDAKTSSEHFYNDEIIKLKEAYEKTILNAKNDSDLVIKKAEEEGLKEKEDMIKSLKSRQDKAIDEIMKILI